MKIEFRVVVLLSLLFTAMVLVGAVTKCFSCKENYANKCHSPVTDKKKFLDETVCGEEKPAPNDTAAEQPPENPDRLVEFGSLKIDYKCITVVGLENISKAKMTYRGCHIGTCSDYPMSTFVEPDCKICDEDLCNSSVRFHPTALGLLIGLWIPISRLVLEWSKFNV